MSYTLIRSKRRRRSIALRISDSGEILVNAPFYTPKILIDRFVHSKSSWIKKHQSKKALSTPPKKHFKSLEELKDFVRKHIENYSASLDLHPSEIKFKKVKSYWGNCHSSGRLSFNLALIYAPKRAVEYVVVHELAHLKHKGHGKRFWNLVNQHCSHTKESRKTLRSLKLPHQHHRSR